MVFSLTQTLPNCLESRSSFHHRIAFLANGAKDQMNLSKRFEEATPVPDLAGRWADFSFVFFLSFAGCSHTKRNWRRTSSILRLLKLFENFEALWSFRIFGVLQTWMTLKFVRHGAKWRWRTLKPSGYLSTWSFSLEILPMFCWFVNGTGTVYPFKREGGNSF